MILLKEEINLVKIFEIVLKLWWIILIFAIVGALVAFSISSFFMTPLYTSTAKVYVSGSDRASEVGVNINDINLNQRLVSTYIEILSSNAFLEDVAQAYNKQKPRKEQDITAGHIRQNIVMGSANETEVLEIKYDDTTPKKAQDILEVFLSEAPEKIAEVIEGCRLKVVDYADLPVVTSSPNIKQNTFIGLFLGIVLGVAVIFVKELFDTRIKGDEDIKNRYGIPVLGIIPNLDVE
ncbi:MAG: hypothetical protein E7395_02400 [Ruminococcaceae bacterium]|nr:hypothetical protein [Oscillospiraceae bacterium]